VTIPNTAVIPVPRLEPDCYDWDARRGAKITAAKSGSHELIFIGDSITHFWESGVTPSYGGPVWDEYYSGRNALNLGYGWDRTQNVLWRLQNGEYAGQSPKLVVVHIGGNNLSATPNFKGNTPAETAEGVAAVAGLLSKMSPGATLLIMAVFPRGNADSQNFKDIREINRLLEPLLTGREKVIFMDIWKKFMTPAGETDSSLYRPDMVHLAVPGYKVWASAIEPVVAASLK
jgi:lysophospholipase L1-like esterase